MATLTAEQKADIRLRTGTTALTSVISDAVLQAYYDTALVDAPDSSMVLPYTYVSVLLSMLGYYAPLVKRTTDHGDNMEINAAFEQTEILLKLWGVRTGLTDANGNPYGTLSVGTLSLGIDATDDNASEWAT